MHGHNCARMGTVASSSGTGANCARRKMLPLASAAGCLQVLAGKPKPAHGGQRRPNLLGWTVDITPHYVLGLTDPPSRLSKIIPFLARLDRCRPTLSVVLRFSLLDESAPLAEDVDSDDEVVAHDGRPCLGRVTTPTAPRSTVGSCDWTQEASVKMAITKAAAQRSRSQAGLVLMIEAFGNIEGKKQHQVLLATGRLGLMELLRTQERRPPRSVLIVQLQPGTAGHAASTRPPIELALSLACHPPQCRAADDPAAGQDSSDLACLAAAGGGHEQADEKVTTEAVSTETQREGQMEAEHKEPIPALPSTPIPALSQAAPPATPARIEVLRQWQQWQREHQHQRQQLHSQRQSEREGKQFKQQTKKAPPRAAGAGTDASASASVRRAQLARMRSLLDELEGLPECLAEIRGGGGAGASRPEGRKAEDKEKDGGAGASRRVAVPRRAGTKRAAT